MLRRDNSEHTTHRITDRTSDASASFFGANHTRDVTGHACVSADATGSASFSQKTDTRRVSEPVPPGTGKGPGTGPLDRVTKSVRQIRMDRYRWQRGAAKILAHNHRVGLCQWALISKRAGVSVDMVEYAEQSRASFAGVQRCGSVWVCPCCSARISEVRRGELNALLSWARSEALRPVMVTLTARHGRDDDLAELLEGMKKAKQRLHRHRTWREAKGRFFGSVTATEVTHGKHGWHPHFHVILLVKADDEGDAIKLAEGLLSAWLASLKGVGLDGTGAGFSVQGASEAGKYVGKWGAGEELTLAGAKRGRSGGRTPAQLLADAVDDDDRRAVMLWREFAEVFHGRRQLVWSRGLKALAGIDETSDADASAEAPERTTIAEITPEQWRGDGFRLGARFRRGRILNGAETGGRDAVMAVVADGGRDDTPEPADAVIEDEPDQPFVGCGDDFDKAGHPENLSVGDGPKRNTVRMKRLSSVSTGNGDYQGVYAKKIADFAEKIRCGPVSGDGFD